MVWKARNSGTRGKGLKERDTKALRDGKEEELDTKKGDSGTNRDVEAKENDGTAREGKERRHAKHEGRGRLKL
jgi:hypothetical protein